MSNVMTIDDLVVTPEILACEISRNWMDWDSFRTKWASDRIEVQEYIYATDTTSTTNKQLPWSNKTTIPKLCQIRDNLHANYMAAMFPKRKWMIWEANDRQSNQAEKIEAIESYMGWVADRNEFYDTVSHLVLDYIEGNAFGTVEWVDETVITPEGKEQVGYAGPKVVRINPTDIAFNPTATDFKSAPKIVRSLVSIGEVKEMIERMSKDDSMQEDAEALYSYMKELRGKAMSWPDTDVSKDRIFEIAGFTGFREYLESNTVEVLTFYGDIYDSVNDTLLKNHVIKVVDRHKVLSKRPNPSFFGTAPIFHAGWRQRPDNIWSMGALDNLVGMQYRIDHLENMKADLMDLTTYPVQKIRGYVEDYSWQPMEKIYVGDDGDVELLSPPTQALQVESQIASYEMKMEEMAGSPKEAMGFRTPGEKTMYEVQRLENAASRIFQAKISQFERTMLESLLNAMLELSRRNVDKTTIRVFNQEFKIAIFNDMTAEDITGNGRIKPVAARHFAERAQHIQDLTTFFGSSIGADPEVRVHFSSVEMARLMEDMLDLDQWPGMVEPYIRITERKEATTLQNVQQEQAMNETMTPSGLTEDDYDEDALDNVDTGSMAEGTLPGGA